MVKHKLRHITFTGRSTKGMLTAEMKAMRALEIEMNRGWWPITMMDREYGGYAYQRKTDEYQIECWMVKVE